MTRRLLLLASITATALGCGGRDGRAPRQTGSAATWPSNDRVDGVANFGVVSGDLWRGDSPSPTGYRSLAARGVKTIVSLRMRDTTERVPAGVMYVAVPTSGWNVDELDVARVLAAIDGSPKPVFIHCRQGRDRTGLAVAAYRLSRGGTFEDAVRELDAFGVNPWHRPAVVKRLQALADSRAAVSRPAG